MHMIAIKSNISILLNVQMNAFEWILKSIGKNFWLASGMKGTDEYEFL